MDSFCQFAVEYKPNSAGCILVLRQYDSTRGKLGSQVFVHEIENVRGGESQEDNDLCKNLYLILFGSFHKEISQW